AFTAMTLQSDFCCHKTCRFIDIEIVIRLLNPCPAEQKFRKRMQRYNFLVDYATFLMIFLSIIIKIVFF
ncbi:MAG: hypothetical protein K2K98_09310, partial [Muribaculaceae bacterium]|nr:hypothetical protein [Muribaculaceae bacterium]